MGRENSDKGTTTTKLVNCLLGFEYRLSESKLRNATHNPSITHANLHSKQGLYTLHSTLGSGHWNLIRILSLRNGLFQEKFHQEFLCFNKAVGGLFFCFFFLKNN